MSIDLTSAERAELDRLRRENHLLRVEKEMLLRIATEYALERAQGYAKSGLSPDRCG
ncbi:hypothetical protein [Saccharopolyspora hattusasensis]|uniref:hypothetical protein n=1 Tax=Saccharopolyspora hattusasensis TaxID=1128679 RepID=UPI003D97B62C